MTEAVLPGSNDMQLARGRHREGLGASLVDKKVCRPAAGTAVATALRNERRCIARLLRCAGGNGQSIADRGDAEQSNCSLALRQMRRQGKCVDMIPIPLNFASCYVCVL